MKKSLGFTLAEVIITIGIVGIIAAITLPIIISQLPDRDENMHKKATQMVEDIVAQMANDEIMYPKNREFTKQGFKNVDPIVLEGTGNDNHTYEGDTKFCELFTHKFTRVYSKIKCENIDDSTDQIVREFGNVTLRSEKSSGDFTTSGYSEGATYSGPVKLVRTMRSGDDIDWYIPPSDFQSTEIGDSGIVGHGYSIIIADINTADRGDNCMLSQKDQNVPNRTGTGTHVCKKPDTFLYYVRANGTVTEIVPTFGAENPYSITVKKTCAEPPTSGNPDSCGTISIKNEDGTDVEGSSYANGVFSGLESNKTYILKTTPTEGYYSNWNRKAAKKNADGTNKTDATGNVIYETKKNERAITITGYDMNTTVKIRYFKQSKLCIYLKVNDCEVSSKNPTECVTASIKRYASGSYIGKTDASGNEVTPELENVTTSANTSGDYTIYACDIEPGDYQIQVTGKDDYMVLPIKTTLDESNQEVLTGSTIIQPIKLGSEDVTFNINVAK